MPVHAHRHRRPAGRIRRTALAALAAALVPLSVVAPDGSAPASAAVPSVSLSATAPTGGNDYATQTFGDPWDFSNAEDQPLVDGATTADLNSAAITGGRLVVDAKVGGFVSPLVSWDDLGAVPWGRDGSLHPIDAGRYTRLSVHMKVDRNASGTVMWFTCGLHVGSCQGQKDFATTAGWRTYDVPLTTGAGGKSWQGLIKGLRFYPSNPGGRAEIDWIRLYSPGQTTTVSFDDNSSGSAPQVIWDADTDQANNATGNPRWGRLDATGSGGTRTFQAGALPSGTYRVGVVDDGRTTYTGSPLVVNGPPAPVVLDPDVTGGMDYATLAGNPWDFDDARDVYRVSNADSSVANGLLYARNRGPIINDPHVVLSQYGPIDGSRFHRLTVRMGHEGSFSLEDRPDAGMNSRFVWTVPRDPGMAQVSDDLVVYPGWHTNTIDLATSPSNAVQEPGTPGQAGWAGQQITQFRIDPNEDRGDRQWYIDHVRLAEDDTGYGGTFDIRFRDLDWQPGTTATLRADTNRTGCDGTVVASGVKVTSGVNTVRWAPRPVPSGTYWICLTLSDGTRTSSAYATGPLQMTTRQSPVMAGGSPFGAVDTVTRVPGGVSVSGWAIDPDTTDAVDVHVYAGSRGVPVKASAARPDIAAAHPVYGGGHGFSVTVPANAGPQDVCAYAINVGTGSTTLLRCQRIDVRTSPVAGIERTRQVPGGVRFEGWALDPDTADPIDVHAYVGSTGAATRANGAREDIARAFPGYGSAHGFGVTVPVTRGGPQALCTYGINVGAGGTAAFGCPTTDVRVDPWGALDSVQRVSGGVRVTGWTIDPSTKAGLDVHVYVAGAGTAVRADKARPDLVPHFPDWGGAHGYDAVLPAPSGPVQVCAYGINQGPGGHVLLGCRSV